MALVRWRVFVDNLTTVSLDNLTTVSLVDGTMMLVDEHVMQCVRVVEIMAVRKC